VIQSVLVTRVSHDEQPQSENDEAQ
jgi:hypothetical protein